MKMTKRIATMVACAVMAASSMVGIGASAATDDYGNTISTAYTLTTSGCYGTINYSGDVDFFSFTPSVSGVYYFYTTGNTDTSGTLYNSNGSIITASSWGFAKDKNMMVAAELNAGTKYYVAVNGSYSNTTGSYGMNVGWASLYAKVNRLVQSDLRWTNVHLGNINSNPTIGSQGCALTSFTMVLNFWNNSSKTPIDVNNDMGVSAYDFQWTTAKSKYNLQLTSLGSSDNPTNTNSGKKFAIEQLKLGRPVIIGMKSPKQPHFVVATGYYNGEIYIKDPGGKNYTKLSQYLNNSYYIYEAFAYYK